MTTKLGEYEEVFLDGLRALGWTIEPPATEVYEPKVDDRVLVTFSENDTTFGTVTEVNGSNDFTVLCELAGGARPISMGRKHLSPLDEFDVLDCPRAEHAGVDCPGDACRFAADDSPGKLTVLLPPSRIPTPAEDEEGVRIEPKIDDRVRVADVLNGDRFGKLVEDRGATVSVLLEKEQKIVEVARVRVTHPHEVGHDVVVGWNSEGDFVADCSCLQWDVSGAPDEVRAEATAHGGSYRNLPQNTRD